MSTKSQSPGNSGSGRAPSADRLASNHFQVGKDYSHAAHRHEDGEAEQKPRIHGTLRYAIPTD